MQKQKLFIKKKFDKQTLSNADVYEVHFLEIEKFYSKKKSSTGCLGQKKYKYKLYMYSKTHRHCVIPRPLSVYEYTEKEGN